MKLHALTISNAMQHQREGRFQAKELVQACLDRIAALEPRLNAVIHLNSEALAEARMLDGKTPTGPLHGIPLIVKDNIDVQGMPSSMASPLFRSAAPAGADSGAAARLRAAGAVIVGKANMDELASHVSGTTSVNGPAVNPWQPERRLSPGGSSSGTATAVAAGYCLGGLGSDTGGSIRLPAAWCGLVGLRPTPGAISITRTYPRSASLDVIGPLARTVKDAALLFAVLAGMPGSSPNVPAYAEQKPRIGLLPQACFAELLPEVEKSFQEALESWKEMGASFREVELPCFSDPGTARVLNDIRSHEFARDLAGDLSRKTEMLAVEERMHPIPAADYERGCKVSFGSYLESLGKLRGLAAQADEFLRELDFLLLPAAFSPALPVDSPLENFAKARAYLDLFSMAGVPTLVVPGGLAKGLPCGTQLIGSAGADRRLLAFGMAYEKIRGPFPAPAL